ncbi:MAG: patatin-like phospholipase family protein [Verrucomicrobiota bacterium]
MKNKKATLVLGSGGARGWAHIGVIRALREENIKIESIVGCSMGALVGAALASGKLDVLERTALEMDWRKAFNLFFEFTLPRSGLIDGKKVTETLRGIISSVNIEDLRIPFTAMSTDMSTGKEVAFSSGDLLEAVRASISIPGIFTPVFRGDQILVDGGLVAPVPVKKAYEAGARRVVAVNINKGLGMTTGGENKEKSPRKTEETRDAITQFVNNRMEDMKLEKFTPVKRWLAPRKTPSILDVVGNSTIIIQQEIAEAQLQKYPPDLLIEPDLGNMNFMEFHHAQQAIQKGYEKAKSLLN